MYSDKLTKKEKIIYRLIVLEGFNLEEIADCLRIKKTTLKTHYEHILQKFQITGNNRVSQLIFSFWKGVMENMNCEKCIFNKIGICSCKDSYFYGDKVNSEMICNKFKEDKGKEVESEYRKRI